MLKLFNLDLHISVISDVKYIIEDLYKDEIDITVWSISGHRKIMNFKEIEVDIINENTWKNISNDMIKQFQSKYRNFLDQFDGFIVTHTPVFALIYQIFNKPIILVNSCRYEMPFSWIENNNINSWSDLNFRLKSMYDTGQLIAISNNKVDQIYLKRGTGVESKHIPSLCLYTNSLYKPIFPFLITYSQYDINFNNNNILHKNKILSPGFKWSDLYSFKGIIHFPYEVSTMSIFEQYSACIPLFFPTKAYLIELIKSGYNLNSRYHLLGGHNNLFHTNLESILSAKSDWYEFWLSNADYYDTLNMPYINYFNSIDELNYLLVNIDIIKISNNMQKHNVKRKLTIYNQWKSIINNTFNINCKFI